jgi:hypothetical protein
MGRNAPFLEEKPMAIKELGENNQTTGGIMPVDIKHLKECLAEAERFVNRARTCFDDMVVATKINKNYSGDGIKTGAVRRSSMDLTRALANLRKT